MCKGWRLGVLHTHAGMGTFLIHSMDSISLSLPVIYKAINPSELQLLPHTAPGADLLLSNNTAANGPEPAISLPADHTHSTQPPLSGFIYIHYPWRKSLKFVCLLRNSLPRSLICILTRLYIKYVGSYEFCLANYA